jgi:hypothetical protein
VNIPIVNDNEDDLLDSDFRHELAHALKDLSKNKAASSDTIPNEAWNNMNDKKRAVLLDSINHCWNNFVFPSEWSNILMVPIFKKGDKSDPVNYRPISLVNTGFKLITSLLTTRLHKWCTNKKAISEFQGTYTKGYGCDEHIFVLNSILQCNVKRRRKIYALFVDLSKAFDTIRHEKLWKTLLEIGLSDKFVSFVQNIYASVKATIRCN